MPVSKDDQGRIIHTPKKPGAFEFDSEVADIFDDMARRSIPLFFETHKQHARLAEPWLTRVNCSLLDIGASRGAFLRAVDEAHGLDDISAYATDCSPAMVALLSRDFPNVNVSQVDITRQAFMNCPKTYDVINMTYVLQFIRPELQRQVLAKVCGMVRQGGVLFFGHKRWSDSIGDTLLHHEYIKWRMDNGYTAEEIEAKTEALRNSMWPMVEEEVLELLSSCGMYDISRTSSWTVFSNFMCIKR